MYPGRKVAVAIQIDDTVLEVLRDVLLHNVITGLDDCELKVIQQKSCQ